MNKKAKAEAKRIRRNKRKQIAGGDDLPEPPDAVPNMADAESSNTAGGAASGKGASSSP